MDKDQKQKWFFPPYKNCVQRNPFCLHTKLYQFLERNKLLLHSSQFFQLCPCINHSFFPQNTAVTEMQKPAYKCRKITKHWFDLTTNEEIKKMWTKTEQFHCLCNCFFLLVHAEKSLSNKGLQSIDHLQILLHLLKWFT